MTRRRILARLPLESEPAPGLELVLSELQEPGSLYVRFESARFVHETGERALARHYIAARPLRSEVLRTATEDFVRRYLSLVIHDRFGGDHVAALAWLQRTFSGPEAHGNA